MSKSLKAAYEKFDSLKPYSIDEAIKLMVDNKIVKFDATAEVHFRLGIEPKHADQQIRSTVSLPNGTGKSVKIVVICSDDKAADAKAAGASEVGGEELVAKMAQGWTDFDVLVASPDMMRHLAKAARVLGPKGLMPNPKTGTVTPDVTKAVKELAAGKMEFRNDKYGNLHIVFGKLSFGEKKLKENLEALMQTIKEVKPSGQKGEYIKNITINSTMGPGIKIQLEEK